jgi:hypothetical protein
MSRIKNPMKSMTCVVANTPILWLTNKPGMQGEDFSFVHKSSVPGHLFFKKELETLFLLC